MKYINIFYLNLSIMFLFSACMTHPSPNPEERRAKQIYNNVKNKKQKVERKNIYFALNSFEITPRAKETLSTIINKLKKNSKIRIGITGHTSKEGSDAYNLTLSHSRASAIHHYLLSKGLHKEQIIEIAAKGYTNPICKDKTSLCKKKNRRVLLVMGENNYINTNDYQLVDTKIKMLREGKSKGERKQELILLQQDKHMPYKIGSGDKFNISIYGEPELTVKGGIVKPDGTLTIAMVGDVKVSTLSINEAMLEISKKLRKYLMKPIVSLIPASFRAQSYTILGKINTPGNYPVYETSKVLDSIADAGGFSIGIFKNNTIELADLEHAFIRRGTSVLPVDFMELVRKGNPLHNISLQDKDYIYIPSALNTEIYMLGEVKETGYFGYRERMTLTQLVSYAGGYTDKANIEQVAVIRGYLDDPSVYLVNLEEVLEGKSVDFMLQPFDIIFIPKSNIGDWNTMLELISPSLEKITSGYLLQQLFLQGSK
jgi:polysaccharide export outer membrane protein